MAKHSWASNPQTAAHEVKEDVVEEVVKDTSDKDTKKKQKEVDKLTAELQGHMSKMAECQGKINELQK